MAHALWPVAGLRLSQLTPPSFEGKVYALSLLRNPDTLSVDHLVSHVWNAYKYTSTNQIVAATLQLFGRDARFRSP